LKKVVKEKRDLKKSSLNSYDIGKLILQCICAYKWNKTAETPIAS